jgi:Flp pilus assembly protein TadD
MKPGDAMRTIILRLAAASLLCLGMGGCKSVFDDSEPETALTSEAAHDNASATGPESVWLEKAKQNYKDGNYGLAERYFRQAVEERHNNAEAWLGLAASYDRLKRFDHAERAYDALIKLAGHTPTVLNNLAYHQMLRGDFPAARRSLEAAQQADPGNPYVKNNFDLLAEWEAKAGKPG